jgi:hypothetical protein
MSSTTSTPQVQAQAHVRGQAQAPVRATQDRTRTRASLRIGLVMAAVVIGTTRFGVVVDDVRADEPTPFATYAFAQQKVYGMTLTAAPGGNATLVGDAIGFAVKMSTSASVDSLPGIGAQIGGLDALQAFIGSGLPLPPPENYTNNTPVGFSLPVGERVLQQLNPTGQGGPKGITNGIPVAADFVSGHNFGRGDAYVAPNPNVLPLGPGSGTIPPNVPLGSWPPLGSQINRTHLFAPIGSADTLSIDAVAETLLTDIQHGVISNGLADWVVTGKFAVTSPDPQARVGVSFDFNVIERMVVYSSEPLTNIAVATNSLAFDVLDSLGGSVFGGLLGSNPSIVRLLSSPATGAETYNNHTNVPTHVYPGPGATNFQTVPLGPGDYSFTLKGTSTAYVSALPEPGMTTAVALAAAGGGAAWMRQRRRRLHAAGSRR